MTIGEEVDETLVEAKDRKSKIYRNMKSKIGTGIVEDSIKLEANILLWRYLDGLEKKADI